MNTTPQDKILVVDDATANLQLLTDLLTKHGYTVYPASDGELALEFVRSTLVDLILLDIRMPGMDGFEVCRRLKAEERTRAIPVIFISILKDENDKVKGFQAGAVDYITKPFRSEEVLARVRTHLRLQKLTDKLDQEVRKRTEELATSNQLLLQELAERQRAEALLRENEEELSIYRDHLEELVRERTAELEAANRELEAFAYSVSHDLRAPLRHIDGFVELLQKNTDAISDQQIRHYMDIISDSAKRMGLLIDDLLSFSRMGRNSMSIRPLELEPLVRDVIRELMSDAGGRTIDWRIGDLPVVIGDASMLRIVMINLISNAMKFTRPRQETRIEIGSWPGKEAETMIYVRDNGVGFDMAFADKLYGVFQRLHHADEFEGTGIGLANVRRIIARHGGRTWAEGEVDRGATFFFALPQVKGDPSIHQATVKYRD